MVSAERLPAVMMAIRVAKRVLDFVRVFMMMFLRFLRFSF